MSVLIIVESQFGNTRHAADAVAEGLHDALGGGAAVEVVDAADAGPQIPAEVRLLLVGGPTHAFSMTRERTREGAHEQGATAHEPSESGIREWIESVQARPDVPVYTFDTRVKVPGLPGSAAKSALKALQHRGFQHVERGETFWVEDTAGPLKHDEIDRAKAWGAELAGHVSG
ncbi:flavodoxin/nitric oxide synthase [Citricoccus sp. SGAir0253]|uniref:flavodoxin family protein n=1 Tax=Citricoccus sp. SGAir0253 TaxID=2567881 RepID=UPI0010CD60DC|nr:flavodoxin/nitric oxide synthase [Citricoccus sp. SGAir0253]QCU77193.1 flavodoxin/nitric oxide synthase [Citricoccus sp. SGAir0253]